MTVGIVGAGVFGRLLALRLNAGGAAVTLFERGPADGSLSASAVAAGMLAPWCELERGGSEIFTLGLSSLRLWPRILEELGAPELFTQNGTLVLAHSADRTDFDRFRSHLAAKSPSDGARHVQGEELRQLEPRLDRRFQAGIWLSMEAHVHARRFLEVTSAEMPARGIECHFNRGIQPRDLDLEWVVDCRGIGAAGDLSDLRAVRGEIITVESQEVRLQRPVRVLHPRFPLYIVPLEAGRFLIGATEIESADVGPVTLRSALELLSAAFAVHPAFGEAKIVNMTTGLRPAFPDNQPRLLRNGKRLIVNGLFRHGFLLSPPLAEQVAEIILQERRSDEVTHQRY